MLASSIKYIPKLSPAGKKPNLLGCQDKKVCTADGRNLDNTKYGFAEEKLTWQAYEDWFNHIGIKSHFWLSEKKRFLEIALLNEHMKIYLSAEIMHISNRKLKNWTANEMNYWLQWKFNYSDIEKSLLYYMIYKKF